MFSAELKKLLIEVITSWQVLSVTGVLILYVFLVNYVARLYHRRPRGDALPRSGPEISDDPISEESGGPVIEEETPGER